MTDTQDEAARLLRRAYADGPVAPLRAYLDPVDIDAAYAIQDINTRFWTDQGRRVIGRKVGLTSRVVQQQLGVDQPDFGTLFDDMRIADGGTLDWSRVLQPKAEAEVALILGRDIVVERPGVADIVQATDSVAAAIEIVDSRIADWAIKFADTVADNGSSALFVLGERRALSDDLDLYACGMVMEVDSAVASLGAGAACLGHPLNAAAWLAATLRARGETLRAGDIVLTGALGPMVALRPGQHVCAVIGGLGSVSFSCGRAA